MDMSAVHHVWPNHLARHSERGKKTRQTDEEVGRQHQGMDRPGVRQIPEGSGEQGKNGRNCLRNHLWCPNDPRSHGIDEDNDDDCEQFWHRQGCALFDVVRAAFPLLTTASCSLKGAVKDGLGEAGRGGV